MIDAVLLVGWLRGRRGETGSLMSFARIAGLGALFYGLANQVPPGRSGAHLAVLVLMVVAGAAWVLWLAGRHFGWPAPFVWTALASMAAVGGAIGSLTGVGLGFVAVAGLGAGIAFDTGPALAIVAIGIVSVIVSVAAGGTPVEIMAEGALSAVAGLMVGNTRRQYIERTRQAEELLEERVRADAERDRAAALAERNRLGRELHDVLAHSLGALSVQLDAVDAILDDGDTDEARRLVRQARRIAVQGLEETRQAVHALRDEPVALAEQLAALVAHDGAAFSVTGAPRPLEADAAVGLYRAAQEAITNARKHAPGAPVSVRLDFGAGATVLTVSNAAAANVGPSALASTGGGYGLQGMRERIELLGGHLACGPDEGGWRVEATVPA